MLPRVVGSSNKSRLVFSSFYLMHSSIFFSGLSGSVEGRKFILGEQVYIDRLIELAGDDVVNVVKETLSCLINIAGDELGVRRILDSRQTSDFCVMLMTSVLRKDCGFADLIAMLLSNMTRTEMGVKVFVNVLSNPSTSVSIDLFMEVLSSVNHNPSANLHFLAPFLANLSQAEALRGYFLNPESQAIVRVLPFTQHQSGIRRQAASTILKNCCFDTGLSITASFIIGATELSYLRLHRLSTDCSKDFSLVEVKCLFSLTFNHDQVAWHHHIDQRLVTNLWLRKHHIQHIKWPQSQMFEFYTYLRLYSQV